LRKFLTWTLILSLAVVVLALSAKGVFCLYAKQQVVPSSHWKTFKTAKVVFDQKGIPTLTADHWRNLIEAQGYVVASERMWQMDLMRRKASGRLAEWFGSKALAIDIRRRVEDWPGVLESASTSLPDDERLLCETYAKGVNRFIEDFEGSWGIEYRLLGDRPEPWSCRDSLAVVLTMSEVLTGYVSREAKQHRWRSHLSRDWQAFLFPRDHPWNRPLFNDSQARATTELSLPAEFIDSTEGEKKVFNKLLDYISIGSNSWAARDKSHRYLANDPHLAYSVPMLWYAMRLRISPEEWVVGIALPGIPGIIIGMNPHYAWSFTTTNEDVDDLIEEKIDPGKNFYLAREDEWRPIKEEESVIEVKDQDPVVVKVRSTHRGPLIEVEDLPGRLFSRQWLPLKPGMLRLPVIKLNQARDWRSFNMAIDQMKNPAQNVTYVDRKGNIGIRIAGTGVIRRRSGRFIHQGEKGEWLGFEDPAARRRAFYAAEDPVRFALPITNQRMWIDDWGHHWDDAGDEKKGSASV